MVRTKTDNSPTQARLLDAAERLMLAKGFAATTVDQICAAARLTKGSFFHYFKSKDDLGRALLERFCAASQARMQAAPCCGAADPLERVLGHVDWAIARSKDCDGQHGCLLGHFAQELSDTHPAMRQQCARAFEQWALAFQRDLDAAKARYAPRAAIDTRSLAEHFIAVLEGSMILAKAKRQPKAVEQSLRHYRRYVEQLFG